jgi:cell wall-associated NlpC family hydrolase
MLTRFQNWLTFSVIVSVLMALAACSSNPPAYNPTPIVQADTGPRAPVIDIATSLLGTPYHYGGITPHTGFDCSGFVYYTHQQIGRSLPRTSVEQYRRSLPVSRGQLRPGDLVFFHSKRGRIDHVGIYLGSNRFIHSPGKGKVISVTSLDHPYWRPRFVRGGRL